MSIMSESSYSSSNESLNLLNKNEEDIPFEVKFAINIIINKFYITNDLKGKIINPIIIPTPIVFFSSSDEKIIRSVC